MNISKDKAGNCVFQSYYIHNITLVNFKYSTVCSDYSLNISISLHTVAQSTAYQWWVDLDLSELDSNRQLEYQRNNSSVSEESDPKIYANPKNLVKDYEQSE